MEDDNWRPKIDDWVEVINPIEPDDLGRIFQVKSIENDIGVVSKTISPYTSDNYYLISEVSPCPWVNTDLYKALTGDKNPSGEEHE